MNACVQLIDFLADGGHYDYEKFPTHAKLIDEQCENLGKFIGSISLEQRIDLVIGLSRIPIVPVTGLINICLENISNAQFALRMTQLYLFGNENLEKLVKNGTNFIAENDQTSQMICHYLRKRNIPITAENIREQISEVCKTVLADAKLEGEHDYVSSQTRKMGPLTLVTTNSTTTSKNHTCTLKLMRALEWDIFHSYQGDLAVINVDDAKITLGSWNTNTILVRVKPDYNIEKIVTKFTISVTARDGQEIANLDMEKTFNSLSNCFQYHLSLSVENITPTLFPIELSVTFTKWAVITGE